MILELLTLGAILLACWPLLSIWRLNRRPLREPGDLQLEPTCARFGHEPTDEGCRWCDDLVPMWAEWHDERTAVTLDPKGAHCYTDRANDPRILRLVRKGSTYSTMAGHHTGIAWVDRSIENRRTYYTLPSTSLAEQKAPRYYADDQVKLPAGSKGKFYKYHKTWSEL